MTSKTPTLGKSILMILSTKFLKEEGCSQDFSLVSPMSLLNQSLAFFLSFKPSIWQAVHFSALAADS